MVRYSKFAAVLLLAIGAFMLSDVRAEEEQSAERLFGTWGGALPYLEERGIKVDSILTNDLVGNTSGGVKRTSGIVGNYDLTAEIDTEKLVGLSNGQLFVYLLGNYGRKPTEFVGDAQGTDNIEAYSTVKLYEFWYEHSLFDGKVGVLVGLHDFNSEFDGLNYAGELSNGSFGISADISQAGPSIFPTTSMAVRLKVLPTEESYFLTALYDGIPGDPNNPRGTHIRFDSGDGLFWGSEIGLLSPEDAPADEYYKAGLGYWYHTANFEDFNGNERDRNGGIYFIAEKALFHDKGAEQGLGAFFQMGFTHADRNEFSRYFGGGFSYTGLIPSRDEDVLSFGIAYARNGDDFLDANTDFERAEIVYELNYKAAITPYFWLRPDVQIVANPSTDPSLDNAVVVGLRTELSM